MSFFGETYPLHGPFLLVDFSLASDLSHIGIIADEHLATLLSLSLCLSLFHLSSLSFLKHHSSDTASPPGPGPGLGARDTGGNERGTDLGLQEHGVSVVPLPSLPFPFAYLISFLSSSSFVQDKIAQSLWS